MSLDKVYTRRLILLSYWLVIGLGVPVWYFTTRVSRAPLPSVPHLPTPQPAIGLALQDGVPRDLIAQANALQSELRFFEDPQGGYPLHISNDFTTTIENGDSIRVPRETAVDSFLEIFADERRRIRATSDEGEARRLTADLRTVQYGTKYDILFSLMNGAAEAPFLEWPMHHLFQHKVSPWVDALSSLANISIADQVQLFTDLTFEPPYDTATGEYVLDQTHLAGFVNSAEWNLATASGDSKPLNLMVYVPAVRFRPLIVRDNGKPVQDNAFLLPQAGAVVIYNPPESLAGKPLELDVLSGLVDVLMGKFAHLMGLPEIAFEGDATLLQLDGLCRHRTVEACSVVRRTLESLHKVVHQIPNMHVPVHVGVRMQHSIDALDAALSLLNGNTNHSERASIALTRHSHVVTGKGYLESAMALAKIAHVEAERAFFDDKMVSLLYFPDEHKYGVYMPLFGPVFIPLILALVKEAKAFRTQRREKRRKTSELTTQKTEIKKSI
ncbi:GPI transamidase component [Savitreella phatthalungensis]